MSFQTDSCFESYLLLKGKPYATQFCLDMWFTDKST